uniref:Peptidase family M13 n=1 Tax=Musca domestica TaxID=7370 RepID=T1PDP9_MUSDO
MLMNSLDMDYRPCSNFYRYACNKWYDQQKELGENYTSVAEMLNYDVNMELIEYLRNTPETDMPGFVKLVKDFYVSCHDTSEFTLLDFMHLMEREDNMKWALFTPDDSKDFQFDWSSISAMFRKYGFNNIFLSESRAYQDANRVTPYLNMPNYKETFVHLIKFQMEEYNRTIPLPRNTMSFEDLWKLIEPFENKLRKIKVEQQQQQPKILKFQELPYPWMQSYLKALIESQVIDPNMEVGIDNMAYMEALDNLLQQYDAKFLARYMELRFLEISYNLNKGSTDNQYMTMTKSLLPLATEWIYEQLHPEVAKQEMPKIAKMFENVVKNVNNSLHRDTSGIIPKELFKKLETMQLKVGILPQENAKDLLESYYADLQLNPNNYYHNYLKILEFYYKLEQNYFDYKDYAIDKAFFYKTPKYEYNADIQPIYVASMNLLIIPYGLLRPPVYHTDLEDIFNESSLATLMGISLFEAFLTIPHLPSDEVKKISGVVSLYATFESFFSSLSAEEITRYLEMFGFHSVQELKQMFFLNAIHYKCEWYSGDADIVNFATSNLSDFTEAYDCKLNNFMRMF